MATIKRRQFVSGVTAAIATAGFPILGANDRISLGVVGLGGRGTDHLEYYSTLPADCRIAAICDVNQAARERAGALVRKLNNYSPTEYTDMRAVFDSKEIDAVSLPLPNHWHALATIWACQAGKDVYVEKPASHNLFEAVQMVAAARKYNRIVQVGSQAGLSRTRSTRWSCCAAALSVRSITREGFASGAAFQSDTHRTSPYRPVSTGIASSVPRR